MILSQWSAALSERLFRRRKMLPMAFFLSGLLALLMARPFTIIDDTLFFSLICFLISLSGWILCLLTVGYTPNRRSVSDKCTDIPTERAVLAEKFHTTGMYSVMRHPLHVSEFLMRLGVILYVGVNWYIVGAVLLYLFCMEKIIIVEERRLEERFGELFQDWSLRIPAFFPNRKAWQKPSARFALGYALGKGFKSLFVLLLSFVIVHLVKIRVVEFIWTVAPFWLYLGLIALAGMLLMKLLSRK